MSTTASEHAAKPHTPPLDFKRMKIIALGHYRRVGKDSLADFIIEACYRRNPTVRVAKRSWALKLKQICHELYGWAGLREPEFYETSGGALLREVVLPEIGKSPRQIWIDMGTPAIRECVYHRTWVDYLMRSKHDLDAMIITDTRFFNEVEAVRQAGGLVVKVIRPGFPPGENQPDRELLGYRHWDNVIGSSGDFAELRSWAAGYAGWICGELSEPPQNSREKIRESLEAEAGWLT